MRRLLRLVARVAFIAILYGAAHGAYATLDLLMQAFEPDCPTEDSCVVDYRDGEWHVKEVVP